MDTENHSTRHDKLSLLQHYHSLGAPFVALTVVDIEPPVSAEIGNFAILDSQDNLVGWLGGACAKGAAKKIAKLAQQHNKPMQIKVGQKESDHSNIHFWRSECYSEGSLTIYAEPYQNQMKKVLIISSNAYGAAPIMQQIFEILGWQAVLKNYQECQALLKEHYYAIIIATQGTGDLSALKVALEADQAKIFFIASSKKWQRLSRELSDQNPHYSEKLKAVHSPAGLSLGNQPQSIALGVVAKIMQIYNQPSEQQK